MESDIWNVAENTRQRNLAGVFIGQGGSFVRAEVGSVSAPVAVETRKLGLDEMDVSRFQRRTPGLRGYTPCAGKLLHEPPWGSEHPIGISAGCLCGMGSVSAPVAVETRKLGLDEVDVSRFQRRTPGLLRGYTPLCREAFE